MIYRNFCAERLHDMFERRVIHARSPFACLLNSIYSPLPLEIQLFVDNLINHSYFILELN